MKSLSAGTVASRSMSLRRVAAASLLAGALALSGCAAPAQTASQNNGKTVVRYSQGGDSLSFANVLYAQSAGYFKDEGLDMEYLPTAQSSTDTINLLISRQADVVVVSPTATYGALGAKRNVKSYATTTSGASTGITLRNDTIEALKAKGVTPDSPLKERIAALKGLTLAGVGASTSQYSMAVGVFEYGGLNGAEDVKQLTVPDHGSAAKSAREGQSAGYIAAIPQQLLGVAEGWGQTWINFSEVSDMHLDTIPYMEMTSTPEYAKANPEVMQAMTRALYKVEADFKNAPEKVSANLKENWFKDMDQALFDTSFKAIIPRFTQGLTPTDEGFKAALDLFNSTGDRPISLNFDDAYNTEFLTK
jgi:NitT/TauT family transport system substrate-binding protein